MVERRFGPTQGAGTVVRERSGAKPIQAAALGVTALFGILEKGEVGKLLSVSTKQKLQPRVGGSRLSFSEAPGAGIDFFDEGAGAGELYYVRVTDGTEVSSSMFLKNRRDPKANVIQVDAKNGGSWGGQRAFQHGAVVDEATDITATTVETGLTLLEDEYIGGTIRLEGVPTKSYTILSNEADGTVFVSLDEDMAANLAAGGDPTNDVFVLQLENEDKYLAVLVTPNVVEPSVRFDITVFESGIKMRNWDGLSMDPNDSKYFAPVINDDGANDWIEVTDLWTGSITADIQPANYFAESLTLAATQLSIKINQQFITPFGATAPAGDVTIDSLGAEVVDDVITLTCNDATTPGSEVWDVVSAKFGTLANATSSVSFPLPNDFSVRFTVPLSTGANNWAVGDEIALEINVLVPDELIGGLVFPDWDNDKRTSFQITDNTVDSVTIGLGQDMTNAGAITVPTNVLLAWNEQLAGGYDGKASITAADYIAAMGPTTSVVRQLLTKNKGLVKLACPGVTTTSVQKALVALGAALNYPVRYEIPANILDEDSAMDYINDTIGRNEYAVVAFPSWGYIQNPDAAGKLLVSLTGQIMGEEAAFARTFEGYHKAAAGEDAILSKVLELPTGDEELNEEKLNPVGIQVIKKKSGNFVIWNDRTLTTSGGQIWKHKREQLSHYEHILQEGFDWIIFSINDPSTRTEAKASLRNFFIPEHKKRALQGIDVDEGAIIKIDSENNTKETAAAGDMFAELSLWLADTTERFIITISEQGIFEATQ